jgi:hypothetical protein
MQVQLQVHGVRADLRGQDAGAEGLGRQLHKRKHMTLKNTATNVT